ncbi:hypothetical protein LWI29_011392 [Acer saccharum]|uniref:Uncharacterized protein n=1 Tax=Acer saccharum TaxID=4024 RepID=A0AA39RDA3_ACESA|nr:hypothetical protein LWI29_011392 [Acer saccharum]
MDLKVMQEKKGEDNGDIEKKENAPGESKSAKKKKKKDKSSKEAKESSQDQPDGIDVGGGTENCWDRESRGCIC